MHEPHKPHLHFLKLILHYVKGYQTMVFIYLSPSHFSRLHTWTQIWADAQIPTIPYQVYTSSYVTTWFHSLPSDNLQSLDQVLNQNIMGLQTQLLKQVGSQPSSQIGMGMGWRPQSPSPISHLHPRPRLHPRSREYDHIPSPSLMENEDPQVKNKHFFPFM